MLDSNTDAMCEAFDELARLRGCLPQGVRQGTFATGIRTYLLNVPLSSQGWALLGKVHASGLYGDGGDVTNTAAELLRLALRAECSLRKTPAEADALAALHLWLHDPSGDMDLIEDAAPFHEQCDARGLCPAVDAKTSAKEADTRIIAQHMRGDLLQQLARNAAEPPVEFRVVVPPALLPRLDALCTGDSVMSDVLRRALIAGVGELEGMAPEPTEGG